MPLPDMPDHQIAEMLAESSVFDPPAFRAICDAIRKGEYIQVGVGIVDLAEDYIARCQPEPEPAHSTESLDFARSGRPAIHGDFL